MTTDLGLAQQFLAGFSTEEVYLHAQTTTCGVIQQGFSRIYAKKETKMTAKLGAYSGAVYSLIALIRTMLVALTTKLSGPLQVEFLSGVLRRPIVQVGEIQADNMNSKVLPCPCDSNTKEPLEIMWLRFQPTVQCSIT